jgi:hypothetical protein
MMGVAFSYGPIMTPDGDVLHKLAHVMNSSAFGSPEFDRELLNIQKYHPINQPIGLYWGYLHILAALDALFGTRWYIAHLVMNAIALSGTALICLYAGWTKFNSAFLGAATWIAIVGCWEFVQWTTMTQSEPLYGLALSMAVVLVAFGLSEKRRNHMFAYFFTGLIVASISATLRPPGIVLVVFLSSFIIILAIGTRICARSAGNGLPVSTISKIYILAVPIMLLVGAGILFSPSFLPDLILPKFLEYSALASEGVIINSRPWTYIQPGNDYWHYLLIVLTRFVYFFAFADAAFSTSHNLINCLFYIPFYILILISVTKSFGTQDTADITLANLSLFLFSGIMVFATFHSVTLIDFDWRYRASTHPMMAIMAAHGLYVTYQYWQRKTVIMAQ